jgi:hypothetical protein
MDINKIMAEKCGVVITDNPDAPSWSVPQYNGWLQVFREWDIENPLCREVVREHFRIDTMPTRNGNGDKVWRCTRNGANVVYGKTIAEAEIAVINKLGEEG